MSIIDPCRILLPNHQSTVDAGHSLAHAIYTMPLTILLQGELGSGKTTLFRGFAQGLGVGAYVISPTFALEQRYTTERWGELLHVDLYRLSPEQSREIVATSDDHPGIRCIEWAERLGVDLATSFPHAISIELEEEGNGRSMDVTYRDVPLPSAAEIASWRNEVMLPAHIISHCHAVSTLCRTYADSLCDRCIPVRAEALVAAAELHDLLRIVGMQPDTGPAGITTTPEEESCWEKWRSLYAGLTHEEAAAAFLRERGYAALAEIVAVHGLTLPSPLRATTEQKLLFYADKRVKQDMVVSLEERFKDFQKRYGKGKKSAQSQEWYEEAKALEKELFPNGVPA